MVPPVVLPMPKMARVQRHTACISALRQPRPQLREDVHPASLIRLPTHWFPVCVYRFYPVTICLPISHRRLHVDELTLTLYIPCASLDVWIYLHVCMDLCVEMWALG